MKMQEMTDDLVAAGLIKRPQENASTSSDPDNYMYVPTVNEDDKNGFMLCCHGLDRTKGLDLILHTGGGDLHAMNSLVSYLKGVFGADIRAIVPQIAMSAGTMMAVACRSIAMGKQSSPS